MNRLKTLATISCFCLTLAPLAASAYVGPGAGLSLLGALWALLVAVAAAIVFLFVWPIRRMRRRKREAMKLEEEERKQRSGLSQADAVERASAVPPEDSREPRSS